MYTDKINFTGVSVKLPSATEKRAFDQLRATLKKNNTISKKKTADVVELSNKHRSDSTVRSQEEELKADLFTSLILKMAGIESKVIPDARDAEQRALNANQFNISLLGKEIFD